MEIGSHTLDHKDLANIPLYLAHQQIFDSKMNAADLLLPVRKFNNAHASDGQKYAGYQAAVTTMGGLANQHSDLFALPRVRITNVDIETFAKRVQAIKVNE